MSENHVKSLSIVDKMYYTDVEWSDLERQVQECIIEYGIDWTTELLRKRLDERRRFRFGTLNGLLLLAHYDSLITNNLALIEENERLRNALGEIGMSYGVECSYAHGVDCRGNTVLREKARAVLAERP
jgi:regulator of replication initiation timing